MIRHMAGIAEIVEDIEAATSFYQDVLGLAVQHEPGDPYATVAMPGIIHFGLWSRRGAAETVFGTPEAADRIPLGFSVGFEVNSVEGANQAITTRGWTCVQAPKTESWGQTTSRFFSPSGALCEIAETPWARRISQDVQAGSQVE